MSVTYAFAFYEFYSKLSKQMPFCFILLLCCCVFTVKKYFMALLNRILLNIWMFHGSHNNLMITYLSKNNLLLGEKPW